MYIFLEIEVASLCHTIEICLTAPCGLLAWLEAIYSFTDQDSYAKFCLGLAMCLHSSCLLQTGLARCFVSGFMEFLFKHWKNI